MNSYSQQVKNIIFMYKQYIFFNLGSIPHVTVTSDGILGKCNAKNCSYIVDIRIAPQLDNFTVTANGLQLVLSNYQNITINVSTIDIIFAGSDCLPTSVSLPVVYCAINKNTDSSLKIEAGSYLPLVHFDSIGYSTYATGLQNFTVPLNFKAIDNTSVQISYIKLYTYPFIM